MMSVVSDNNTDNMINNNNIEEAPTSSEETENGGERKLSTSEAAIRRQVSYYFSDENLGKGDDFMFNALAGSSDCTVPLQEIALFKKMKRLVPDGNLYTIADAVYGSSDVEVVIRSDTGELRCRRKTPLNAECEITLLTYVERKALNQVLQRTVNVRNLKVTEEAAVRAQFGRAGQVTGVTVVTQDEQGKSMIVVEYSEPLGAIVAAETLNDEENWRFGLRVSLAGGGTPDQLRSKLELPKLQQRRPPQQGRQNGNHNNGENNNHERSLENSLALAASLPECPAGRFRGRVLFVKEPVVGTQQQQQQKGGPQKKGGNYGLIKPLDAETKDDNCLFLLSDVVPKEIATKSLKNELVEYRIETARDGKKRALDVRVVPQPPKPKAAFLKKSPTKAPDDGPLSKLAALANSVDSKRGTPVSADDAEGTTAERPEHLRRFRGLAKGAGEILSDIATPQCLIAKGPDGTNGFALARKLPSSLRIDAIEWVPPTNE